MTSLLRDDNPSIPCRCHKARTSGKRQASKLELQAGVHYGVQTGGQKSGKSNLLVSPTILLVGS